MKTIFLTLVFILSTHAFAANPQIRVCNINSADFYTLRIESPKHDLIGFCSYGESYVGSISFMAYFFEGYNTMAMDAFFKTQSDEFTTCELAGGSRTTGFDLVDDSSDIICVFDD